MDSLRAQLTNAHSTKEKTILLIYVDDGIILSPDPNEANTIIQQLQHENYKLSDEGELTDYLGVHVHKENDILHLTQPQLIQQIISDVGFNDRTHIKKTPALSSTILSADNDGPPINEEWKYRSIIGKLNLLEKSTRPDIAYAVHQCARFQEHPKESHAKAVKHIIRYLIGTKTKE